MLGAQCLIKVRTQIPIEQKNTKWDAMSLCTEIYEMEEKGGIFYISLVGV